MVRKVKSYRRLNPSGVKKSGGYFMMENNKTYVKPELSVFETHYDVILSSGGGIPIDYSDPKDPSAPDQSWDN